MTISAGRRSVELFDLQFIKDRYAFELSRKDALTAALTLPVGVLTGTGGLLAAMARSFSYGDHRTTIGFLVILGADVVAFVICMVLLGRAYHAQTYVYLPLLAELDRAQREFHEFNAYVANTGGEVDETFEDDLRGRIINAADTNTLSNDLRSKWLHYSRIALFWVLGLTAFAVIPYVVDQVQSRLKNVPPTSQTAQTQQRTATSNAGAAPTTGSPTAASSQGGQPSTAPVKPTFPPNRVIREGQEPGEVRRGGK